LLLLTSLVSSTHGYILDRTCFHPHDEIWDLDYHQYFFELGNIGAKSVDDMIFEELCQVECEEYRRNMDYSYDDIIAEIIDERLRKQDVATNKTFLQLLEPTIKKEEDQMARKANNDGNKCPWWTNSTYYNYDLSKLLDYFQDRFLDYFQDTFTDYMQRKVRQQIAEPFQKVLNLMNTNGPVQKRLMKEAVDTIFESPDESVDATDLFHLYLGTKSMESKGLLKMVVAKYITKYLTEHRITCWLQELTRNKFLTEYFTMSSYYSYEYNIQNEVVRKIINTTSSVLREEGVFPYIDLVHAVIDELEHLNIHEIMSIHYTSYLEIRGWLESVNWDEDFQRFVTTTKILAPVMKTLFCANQGQLGISEVMERIFENVYSESGNKNLDFDIKRLLNVLPSALRRYRNEKVPNSGIVMEYMYINDWSRPHFFTRIIKSNKGALGELLNFKIESFHVKIALEDIILISTEKILNEGFFENISNHLLKGISLSPTEKKTIQEPVEMFRASFLQVFCDFMQKVFKVRSPRPNLSYFYSEMLNCH